MAVGEATLEVLLRIPVVCQGSILQVFANAGLGSAGTTTTAATAYYYY